MKLGIALGRLHPRLHEEMVLLADELGFESVWLPEHLVLPVDMSGSPFAGGHHPPIPADAPVVDCFGYLGYLAGKTTQIRLGTHVYLLGLRHPFVAARAVQTLDLVSRGRAEIGIGAGWLESEWRATGLDPRSRGGRLDEALAVCKRLWSEDVIEHHGEFFEFESVMFEPKPVQRPHPPILVGGESEPALRRAARDGDGWIGLAHDPQSCAGPINRLRELRAEYDRDTDGFEMACLGRASCHDDVERFAEAGITRLLVTPWDRSSEALDGVRRLADQIL